MFAIFYSFSIDLDLSKKLLSERVMGSRKLRTYLCTHILYNVVLLILDISCYIRHFEVLQYDQSKSWCSIKQASFCSYIQLNFLLVQEYLYTINVSILYKFNFWMIINRTRPIRSFNIIPNTLTLILVAIVILINFVI